MTPKERAAMQQALGALEYTLKGQPKYSVQYSAITALREALEQPSQEPVAWGVRSTDSLLIFQNEAQAYHYATPWEFEVTPLYTAPSKRKWVEPTMFQIDDACAGTQTFGEVARAVLKLSKELNNG